MDETLETMLGALEGLDAPSVADRVSALDALALELPQLSRLSSEAWDLKIARIEDDVAGLGDTADRATARFEQARRALETLKRFAADRGAAFTEGSAVEVDLFRDEGPPAGDGDGRRKNPVAQAETTREAILQVMVRRPHREWTPTAIADDLMRYGRPVARSNVQVTVRRLASDGRLRKVGRGVYQILADALDPPQDAQQLTPAERYHAVRLQAGAKSAETKRRKKREAENA